MLLSLGVAELDTTECLKQQEEWGTAGPSRMPVKGVDVSGVH